MVIPDPPIDGTAPRVFASKKDGTIRLCVDYFRINALAIRDAYPIPRMYERIGSLEHAKVFSTLDVDSAY